MFFFTHARTHARTLLREEENTAKYFFLFRSLYIF